MITIRPSPTADTRSCDWSKVTKETLYQSSVQHIADVAAGMRFFADLLDEAARRHDHDKLSAIDHFHADFRTGFKETGWWDNHRKVNRHHLTAADGIPADVNLVDVLDHIVDCVMAGMARSGSVSPLTLDPAVLQRAFDNTVALLKANVTVAPASPAPSDSRACGCQESYPQLVSGRVSHGPGCCLAPAPSEEAPAEPESDVAEVVVRAAVVDAMEWCREHTRAAKSPEQALAFARCAHYLNVKVLGNPGGDTLALALLTSLPLRAPSSEAGTRGEGDDRG